MKITNLLAFLLVFLLGHCAMSQVDTDEDASTVLSPLFSEAESAYIDQWFADFVKEMNLSSEVSSQYQGIMQNYSEQYEAIRKDDPEISKTEIIQQFNALMESQHEEVKSILTDAQYELYYDTMEKVAWSINQRLKQL